jgi:hypothetical protein
VWYAKARDALLHAIRIDQAQTERARIAAAANGRPPATPSTVLAYLELGRVYRRLGEPQRALEVLMYGARMRGDPSIARELQDLQRALGYQGGGQ